MIGSTKGPTCQPGWKPFSKIVVYTAMTDAEFLSYLANEAGYPMVYPVSGRRWVAIRPTLFEYCAIIRGNLGEPLGHRDEWLYPDEFEAELALHRWKLKGFEGEPEGFMRHQTASGAARPGSV
jgi:hypothetical protein